MMKPVVGRARNVSQSTPLECRAGSFEATAACVGCLSVAAFFGLLVPSMVEFGRGNRAGAAAWAAAFLLVVGVLCVVGWPKFEQRWVRPVVQLERGHIVLGEPSTGVVCQRGPAVITDYRIEIVCTARLLLQVDRSGANDPWDCFTEEIHVTSDILRLGRRESLTIELDLLCPANAPPTGVTGDLSTEWLLRVTAVLNGHAAVSWSYPFTAVPPKSPEVEAPSELIAPAD